MTGAQVVVNQVVGAQMVRSSGTLGGSSGRS